MGKAAGLILGSLCLFGVMTAFAEEGTKPPTYVPGLGEFMMATQVRHGKLWFAGSAGNWKLANYELDELNEGLEDAGRLYPTLHDWPIAAMIETNLSKPKADLAIAIEKQDTSGFASAYAS